MTAPPRLQLSAYTHRPWYLPGDTVRVQAYLECVRSADSTKENVFTSLPAEPSHNHFRVDSTAEAAAREAELHVHSLRAAVSGHCQRNPRTLRYEWDASVPIELPMCRSSPRGVTGPFAAGDEGKEEVSSEAHTAERRELFSSRWWTVTEGVYLRFRIPVAHTFSFRLPTNLPPTFHLHDVAAWTEVRLSAQWSIGRAKDGAERHQTTMSLPLRIFNPATSISHFFLGAAFPLDPQTALLKADYEFTATALPPVPSSSVSAPLDDSLYPSESQIKGRTTLFREACVSRQNELTVVSEPATVVVPVGSMERALEVRLLSTIVAMGSAVRGVFVDCTGGIDGDSPTRSREARPVLVRASAALEMLECCPLSAVAGHVSFQPVRGVDGVAMLRSLTVCVQEFALLDTPTTPLAFPLALSDVQPTTLTDLGIVLWQLRVKVQWTTWANLQRSRGKGASTLTLCTAGPELVIPITVVPPRVPERPRRGFLASTFYS